jgi:hypothetical protein
VFSIEIFQDASFILSRFDHLFGLLILGAKMCWEREWTRLGGEWWCVLDMVFGIET